MSLQGIKRFMGVSLPFMLTFGSLCMILIVGINGVPGNFMGPIFKVDTRNLAIPPSSFTDLTNIDVSGSENITAASLGLADKYSFYLWNYASTTGTKTTYHKKHFDWVKQVDVSSITVDGVTSPLPKKFADMRSRFRNEVKFAEAVFLASLLNAFFVVAIGIAGCFGVQFRLLTVAFFSGITLLTMLIFAGLITAAGLGITGDLKPVKAFGLKTEVGASDLGVVWLAAIHMLVVCLMWLLMGLGVMRMNAVLKTPPRMTDGEEPPVRDPNGDDYPMINRRKRRV